jgi:transposase-like protein
VNETILVKEVKNMENTFKRLTTILLEKNENLSSAQARTWIELMWEDFESTYAKAGRTYRGPEMTEQIVRRWIEQYGPVLHEMKSENPKYKHLINRDDHRTH